MGPDRRTLLPLAAVLAFGCQAEPWELLDRSDQLESQRGRALLWFESDSFSADGGGKVMAWRNLGTGSGFARAPSSSPGLSPAEWPTADWSGLEFSEADQMNIDVETTHFEGGVTFFALFRHEAMPVKSPAWVYCFGEGASEFSLRISDVGLDAQIAGRAGVVDEQLQSGRTYLTTVRIAEEGEYVFRINGRIADDFPRLPLSGQSIERFRRHLGGGLIGDLGFFATFEGVLSDRETLEMERTISARYGCCAEASSGCCVE